MKVHFICMGNVYRSRLAEAYLKSLGIHGIIVTSSGVQAAQNLFGPIGKHAEKLLQADNIRKFASSSWQQLNQELVDQADIVIVMNRYVYSAARQIVNLPLRTVIWDVPDIWQLLPEWGRRPMEAEKVAEKTYAHIKERVGELVILLRKPRPQMMLDVYSPDGKPLGRKADVDTIHQQGLWHRGAHAVLYTTSGKLLFEKRSKGIIGNPGLWDLSLGGLVDGGEEPEHALVREIKEEVGLKKDIRQVKPLGVWRYNHYLPRYGLHSRTFVSSFLVEISEPPKIHLQPKEVDEARLMDLDQAEQMINLGRSELGQMVHTQSYFRYLLGEVKKELV